MRTSTSRAALYVRLSKAKRGERQVSLETQEADLRGRAQPEGYRDVEVFVEGASASAFARGDRPEWGRLVKRLADFDAVLAWKQDRLARDEEEWFAFVRKAAVAGTRILTLDGTDIDPEGDADLVGPGVKAVIAAQEARNTSRRARRALAARRAEGKAHGGPRPYGYRREDGGLVVDEAEAAIVRESAERVLAGESLTSVVRDLQRRGVRSAKGGEWRRKALLQVLTSPVTAGARLLDDGSLKVGWEGILSEEERDRLVGLLRDKARRVGVRPRRHVLSGGLLVCGECGARMKGRQHGDRRDYVCPPSIENRGCGGVVIKADPLEDLIVDAAIARLSTRRLRKRVAGASQNADLRSALDERRHLQDVSDWLADERGRGSMTSRQFERANRANENALAALQRRIESLQDERERLLDELPASEAALVEWWENASLAQRHALLATVLDHATIAKGVRGRHGFDLGRVEFCWR